MLRDTKGWYRAVVHDSKLPFSRKTGTGVDSAGRTLKDVRQSRGTRMVDNRCQRRLRSKAICRTGPRVVFGLYGFETEPHGHRTETCSWLERIFETAQHRRLSGADATEELTRMYYSKRRRCSTFGDAWPGKRWSWTEQDWLRTGDTASLTGIRSLREEGRLH